MSTPFINLANQVGRLSQAYPALLTETAVNEEALPGLAGHLSAPTALPAINWNLQKQPSIAVSKSPLAEDFYGEAEDVGAKARPVLTATASKNAQGSKLNPMNWNLSMLIPPLGIASALSWGVSNVLEHGLQDGKVYKNPLIKAAARYAPVVNVAYGALNAVGAYAQGYSMRGTAFTAFTLFSAALTPLMLKNNRIAMQLGEALAGKVPMAKEPMEKLAKESIHLHNWSSLYNAVAPIGLLTGLFSTTKVAQSTPGVKLEHPEGKSLRDFFVTAPKGERLTDVLKRNAKIELSTFTETLLSTPKLAFQGVKDFGRSFKAMVKPEPGQENQNPLSRFLNTIADGRTVPLFYSHATVGRVLASTTAVGLALLSFPALRKHSVYDKVLETAGHAAKSPEAKEATVKGFNRVMNSFLIWGQLAGTPAGLFTRFNDWPGVLSSVYKTSGFAYGASAVGAVANMAGIKQFGKIPFAKDLHFFKDGKVLGFDERTWTKIGAFIQGTSYFVNLSIKNFRKPAEGAEAHSVGHNALQSEPKPLA